MYIHHYIDISTKKVISIVKFNSCCSDIEKLLEKMKLLVFYIKYKLNINRIMRY